MDSPAENFLPGLSGEFPGAPLQRHYYSLHGIGLCLASNEPALLEILRPALKHFRCRRKQLPSPHIHLSFLSCEDLSRAPLAPGAQAEKVSFAGALEYFSQGKDLFTVVSDKAHVFHNLREGWALGFFRPALLADDWSIKQHLFFPPLAELLKQKGLFNVHAAMAADSRGRAILITAPTGAGKSTTLVNLVRAGYSFLSDDVSLLRRQGGRLSLLGFPEPVNLTPSAVAAFPELEFLKKTPKPCPGRKHSLRLEDVYPDCLRKQARPGWLIFPQVQPRADTRLLPLPKREALGLLIPQSVIVANKTIVAQHLQILSQLVQECACFRLQLGKDAREKTPSLFSTL